MSKPAAEKSSVTKVGDYKLGAVLGKGGFGTVYSGLDEENGGFFAIKQINLSKIPKDQLNGIMQEIDLLKNLNHTNIVKYVQYIKTKDHLYIVLELVENGSLSSIIKKFGKFPESLVCVYITQVLEGLVYLHEQGVVHRDIKGANILTTKEGIIKLADFGVATKFGDESASAVVGTPYWMAPEIIELNGSTTASDIWSVGCTVIELLTGAPPYYELQAMPALFRIVNDDYPPLPDGISPALKDWLMQCFQKDPILRISAEKLLTHKWIKSRRKQPTVDNPEVVISQHNKEKPKIITKPKDPAPAPVIPAIPAKKQVIPNQYIEESEDDDWGSDFATPTSGALAAKLPLPKPALKKPSNLKNQLPPPKQTPDPPLKLAAPKKVATFEENDEDWGEDFPSVNGASGGLDSLKAKIGDLDIGDDKNNNSNSSNHLKKFAIGNNSVSKKSSGNLLKFAEKDDDDYDDDDFAAKLAQKIHSKEKQNKLTGSILEKNREKRNIETSVSDIFDGLEDELESIDDVFGEDDFAADQRDLGKTNEEILKLLGRLQLSQAEDTILTAAQELIKLFKENPEHKSQLIRNIGVIPIMEVLEGSNPRVLQSILQVMNQIIENNIEIKENLCLVGGIPAIMKFSGRDYALPVRLECANFVSQMCSTSTVTLQMFIACRGLPVLVDILSTPYAESKALVWLAADAICSVFELQSTTPKNDFCRLFAKAGLLPVLGNVLKLTSEDRDPQAKNFPSKISNLFLIFSAADSVVKLAMSQPQVLTNLLELIDRDRLLPELQVRLLKAIKQLSMDHNTLGNLQSAGAIGCLVRVLAKREGDHVKDMHNHVINTLYNLCKLDQERQFIAAKEGIVPHLQYIIDSKSPFRQFALPVLCDIAHVRRARSELWKHNGVQFYLDLLSDKYWHVNALDALSAWLGDDTIKVEKIMSTPAHISAIVDAFRSSDNATFANLMEPLLHIVTTSEKVNVGMSTSEEFVPKLIERLTSHPKAEVRVNLLRILTILYKCSPNPKAMIAKFSLYPVVKSLTDDKAVLVKRLASQLLVAFNTNTVL